MEPFSPGHPPAQFQPYVQGVLRILMFSMGLRLELVDLSKSMYSSARASLLQCYKSFRRAQRFMVDHLLRRIWQWKISQFIKYEGMAEPTEGKPWDHTWVLPGWEWVRPDQEVKAAEIAVNRGLSSVIEECAARGKDYEALVEQNARAIQLCQEKAAKLGVDWHELWNAAAIQSPGRE